MFLVEVSNEIMIAERFGSGRELLRVEMELPFLNPILWWLKCSIQFTSFTLVTILDAPTESSALYEITSPTRSMKAYDAKLHDSMACKNLGLPLGNPGTT